MLLCLLDPAAVPLFLGCVLVVTLGDANWRGYNARNVGPEVGS
jgi:hypothetical protein